MRKRAPILVGLFALCTVVAARPSGADSSPPVLNATVSWIGNSFSGDPLPGFVPLAVDDISVSGDGIVATNSGYNEAVTSVVLFKDGRYLGSTEHQFGGLDKRSVVAEDPENHYLFYSTYQRYGTGVGRRLCDGKNDPKAVIQEMPANWPEHGFSGRIITGLALRNGLLFVSDNTPGADAVHQLKAAPDDATRWKDFSGVSVVDAAGMRVMRSFPLEHPGKLAATHDGNVWVVRGQGAVIADRPARVLKLSGKDGAVLAQVEKPMLVGAIAVDGRDRLLIADAGPDNNIKIFSPDGALAGTFGQVGGIFSGPTPGLAGEQRFERPRGLGVDSAGNLYVLSVGAVWPAANRIECYAPANDSWGARKWQILGMMFGDSAVFDPGRDDMLYTSHAIFKMDWSQPGEGREWSYQATTLDRTEFRDDPRHGIFAQGAAGRSTFGVRVLHGNRFLYSGVSNVEISRLDCGRGTIAMPAAYVCLRDPRIDRAPDWPKARPTFGGWTWHDANGNGVFDPSEFERFDTDKLGISGQSAVDAAGGIWWFPLRGGSGAAAHVVPPEPDLDPAGNPVYRAAGVKAAPMPVGWSEFGLCALDDSSGDLYVLARRSKTDDYALVRYSNWRSHPSSPPLWMIEHAARKIRSEIWMPDPALDAGALQPEGDYVFIAAARGNSVRVYRKSDGASIGSLQPPKPTPGTFDDSHGLHVHRRTDGEYVLILMDFFHNKNLMYRWRP